MLLHLGKLKNRWVKTALAGNKNTPKSVLDSFAKSDDEYVLAELAKNISIDKKQLLKLSQKTHRWVKWSVLQNQNIQDFTLPVKLHREIVGNCIRGDEEHFHYEIKSSSRFDGSFKFFDDIAKNIEMYRLKDGYNEVFSKMAIGIRDHLYKTDTTEVTQNETHKFNAFEDFETLVAPNEMHKNETDKDFDSLIEQGEIVDFERTDGKGVEKILKIKAQIDDFKSFNQYMKSNKMGYYSRIARGFILYKEFADRLLEKISGDNAKAASVATALYSADVLQNFANGTLF